MSSHCLAPLFRPLFQRCSYHALSYCVKQPGVSVSVACRREREPASPRQRNATFYISEGCGPGPGNDTLSPRESTAMFDDTQDPVANLVHLYVDGAFNRRELIQRV